MAFPVSDILKDLKEVLGSCGEEEIFRKVTSAVSVLANSGEFDPLRGYLDICTDGGCLITLPEEVDTVLAVNIGGRPTIARSQMFNFHLNGMGDWGTPCGWAWQDKGMVPTYRQMVSPSKVVAFVERSEDQGAELWVYGFDEAGHYVKTEEDGEWVNGYRVPTIFGYALPDAGAPTFSRIVAVRKAETKGVIRLSSFDNSLTTGTLLGIFQPDETNPQYRQIKLGMVCDQVRVAYRKRLYKIRSVHDLIPLHSPPALMAMVHALKFYDEGDTARAMVYEANARRWLVEAEFVTSPPVFEPVQVNPGSTTFDRFDTLD